jgi:hypothetical protein
MHALHFVVLSRSLCNWLEFSVVYDQFETLILAICCASEVIARPYSIISFQLSKLSWCKKGITEFEGRQL